MRSLNTYISLLNERISSIDDYISVSNERISSLDDYISVTNEKISSLDDYITEKLKIKKLGYKYFPKTKEELQELLKQLIKERGSEGNFNDIDTSEITDMSQLFLGIRDFDGNLSKCITYFNGDISKWDVSNVENMEEMFARCESFNQTLNNWDISKVTDVSGMFYNCCKFNQLLNDWDVSNVTTMECMFFGCESFNQPLYNWNVSNVKNMRSIFRMCRSFNQDISNWNVSNVIKHDDNMFSLCPIKEKYKPNFK
jgi:surface protein